MVLTYIVKTAIIVKGHYLAHFDYEGDLMTQGLLNGLFVMSMLIILYYATGRNPSLGPPKTILGAVVWSLTVSLVGGVFFHKQVDWMIGDFVALLFGCITLQVIVRSHHQASTKQVEVTDR